jgi:sugar/nucleoside kinase (ribokinase family)
MNPVLVVGSVALDTIETPGARRDSVLGGSATFFTLAARRFAPVRLVGVVGQDFPDEHRQLLESGGVDLEGLQTAPRPTFRWHGRYDATFSSRETVSVDLEILDLFRPVLPESYRDSKYVLLGNTSPRTQATVLSQLREPRFVLLDSMNVWIQTERDALMALLPRVHALCLDYTEARMLAGTPTVAGAIRELLGAGLRCLVVKRAEHGASIHTPRFAFAAPAWPTERVVDPTGAGDAFAGGLLGFLAKAGLDDERLKKALVHGSVMGSLAVESFGPERLVSATDAEISTRYLDLVKMISL